MKRIYICEKCKSKKEIEHPGEPTPLECINRKPGEEVCKGNMIETTSDGNRVTRVAANQRLTDQVQDIQKEDSDLINTYIGQTTQFFTLQKLIRENLDRRAFLQKKLKKTLDDGMRAVVPRWGRKDKKKEWGYDWANKEFVGIQKKGEDEKTKVQSPVNQAQDN